MIIVVITEYFYNQFFTKENVDENLLIKEILFYHLHYFLTKKRRRLFFGFDKIEIKNKPEKSREKGARLITETVIAKVEAANDIYIYTPELLFDVNQEKKYNKKLKNEFFMEKLKLQVKIHKEKIKFKIRENYT